jgi:dTDP-glucose 4,6-dehydratase
VQDRPGHDRRYALTHDKIERELGWRARVSFQAGLEQAVAWYREHAGWWQEILSGEYRRYYERQYGERV